MDKEYCQFPLTNRYRNVGGGSGRKTTKIRPKTLRQQAAPQVGGCSLEGPRELPHLLLAGPALEDTSAGGEAGVRCSNSHPRSTSRTCRPFLSQERQTYSCPHDLL